MTNRKSFTDVSTVLKTIMNRYQLTEEIMKEQIFANWESLVGKEISKMCKPVEFNDNELILRAKNTAWKQELATRQRDLLNLLNGRIKSSLVKKIKII